MAIGKQLRYYRTKLGYTLQQVSEGTGVEVGTLSAIENRNSTRSNFVGLISRFFDLTVEQFTDEENDWIEIKKQQESANSDVDAPFPVSRATHTPVVGVVFGGDNEYASIDDYPVGEGSEFIESRSPDKKAYGLRVRGDSMWPRIKSGEFVLVEPSIEARPGDDVVVKLKDGRALLKEFLWIRDGEMSLGSINSTVRPITIPLENVEKIHRVAAIIPRGTPVIKQGEKT